MELPKMPSEVLDPLPPPPPPPRLRIPRRQSRFRCSWVVVPLAILAGVWLCDAGGCASILDFLRVHERTRCSGLVVLATLLVGILVIVGILLCEIRR
jgi:hypothetical protein